MREGQFLGCQAQESVVARVNSMANLSLRLSAILNRLKPCELLADIGTDHALIPAAAVDRGLARRALGVDLRSAPLQAAEQRLRARGQLDRVELIQANGLSFLGGRGIDALVLAGMSARQMMRICLAQPEVVRSVKQLIMQPNTEVQLLRKWAHEFGLHLSEETITVESERYFSTLSFAPSSGPDPVYERSRLEVHEAYRLGPLLVESRSPEAREYFETQHQRLSRLVDQGAKQHATDRDVFQRALRLMGDSETLRPNR